MRARVRLRGAGARRRTKIMIGGKERVGGQRVVRKGRASGRKRGKSLVRVRVCGWRVVIKGREYGCRVAKEGEGNLKGRRMNKRKIGRGNAIKKGHGGGYR